MVDCCAVIFCVQSHQSDYFAQMAVDAIKSVKTGEIKEGGGKRVARYPVSVIFVAILLLFSCSQAIWAFDKMVHSLFQHATHLDRSLITYFRLLPQVSAVHILKVHGQGSRDSHLVKGYAINCTRAAQGMPTRVGPAKV